MWLAVAHVYSDTDGATQSLYSVWIPVEGKGHSVELCPQTILTVGVYFFCLNNYKAFF